MESNGRSFPGKGKRRGGNEYGRKKNPRRDSPRGRRKEKRKEREPRDFDRYELEVGIPTVKGDEKEEINVVEKKGDKEIIKIGMDSRALAKIEKMKDDITKLKEKVSGYEETVYSIESGIREIKEDYSRLEVIIRELEDMRDSYTKVDKTIRELSALYDLISAQINPFIEFDAMGQFSGDKRWDGIIDNVELIRGNEGVPYGGREGQPGRMEILEDEDGFVDTDKEMAKETNVEIGNEFRFESSILSWLRFLETKMRAEDIPNLLKYYRELGWIGENIEITTLNFLMGSKIEADFTDDDDDIYLNEDGTIIGEEEGWKLSIEDHAQSLEHIERIRKEHIGGFIEGG